MKRAASLLVVGMVLFVAASAFAQAQSASTQNQNTRGYPTAAYVKNIPLLKVYVHPLGYKLTFLRSDSTIGTLYVPLTWFGGTAGKAAITYGVTPDRPYVSIAWVDGTFDHITINASSDVTGPTWGSLGPLPDISAQFNIQEPSREF